MPTDNARPDVAVFIDFENVYVSVRDKLDVNPNFEIIMDRVGDLGRVVIARAYADWYRYPRVTSALYANGIEPMYVPTYYYDRDLGRTGRAIKNSVDMNLCIDAMKTLFTNPNIGKFVLATGDRDFIPLVNSIRQHGKEVIIIGVGGAASAHLAQSADEFIFYEQLIGKKPSILNQDIPRARMPEKGRDGEHIADEPAPPRDRFDRPRDDRGREERAPAREERARDDRGREERAPAREERAPAREERTPPPAPAPTPADADVYDVLVQAVHLARERGYVCSFGSLKLLMKELMGGDFKESRYRDAAGRPFAKFKDFAMEAERRNKVQVFTSGAVVEVFLPGEDPYKLSQFAQDLKEEPPISTPDSPVLVDARIDGRPVSAGNRRRRRRRGGQRPTGDVLTGVLASELSGEGDDEGEAEGEEAYTPPEGMMAGADNGGQSDAVFEELLGRLEAEQARSQALSELDPSMVLDAPVSSEPIAEAPEEQAAELPAELPAPVDPYTFGEPDGASSTALAPGEATVFDEVEWQLLRDTLETAVRPLSFQQIHDLLREARNSAGILRTNEELRTLIKQAINTGMLVRSGKGSRVSYRLAPSAPAEGEAPAVESGDAAPAEGEAPAAESGEAAPAEGEVAVAEGSAEQPAEPAATPAPKRSRRRSTPAAQAAAPAAPAAESAAPPKRSRRKAETPAPAEAPAEAPARPRRRRQAQPAPEAEVVPAGEPSDNQGA